MTKPTMHQQPSAYSYSEISRYIEDKHSVNLRRYKGSNEDPDWRNFWHSLLGALDITRGCYRSISSEIYFKHEWEREILQMFIDEFGDHIRCWFDW